MQQRNQIPDNDVLKRINSRLGRTGLGGQSSVRVVIRNGDVTITGSIQYDAQRRSVLNAIRGVSGVRRVMDQLQVKNTRGAGWGQSVVSH
jgi:osmotically-inducible protein OsmY